MAKNESRFTEVKTSFEDEESGQVAIDAWRTLDDGEVGRVLGWYDPVSDEVAWKDDVTDAEKNDSLVQEKIALLREEKGKKGDETLYAVVYVEAHNTYHELEVKRSRENALKIVKGFIETMVSKEDGVVNVENRKDELLRDVLENGYALAKTGDIKVELTEINV